MNAKQFFKKYPDAQRHRNCLVDVACPHCGQRDNFYISFSSWGTFYDDGLEDYEGIDYDPSSCTKCPECGAAGTLADFTIEGLDKLYEARNRLINR